LALALGELGGVGAGAGLRVMPAAEFFTRLGLFVVKDFLDAETCARLRSEVRLAARLVAAVGEESGENKVDRSARSTEIAVVSAEAEALVGARLDSVTSDIERHFSVEVEGWERLQFLLYKPGDFFEAHQDRSASRGADDPSTRRLVSIVTFLNDESRETGTEVYGGGALTFYGLLGGNGDKQVGLPLVGERGLLVAFDSGLMHSVTPVTHGERFTVVTWCV
jgi:SM-20-related protein